MPTSPDGRLTVTYDPDFVRVGITVNSGFSDAEPITVTRDGEVVRGGEGVFPSGGAYFLWDYEMPLAQDVLYRVANSTLESQVTVTIPAVQPMLRAPGLPSLDRQIIPAELPVISRPRATTTLHPIGRRRPVVLSGQHAAGEFTLRVYTMDAEDEEALLALLETVPVGLLLFPGARRLSRVYVSFGNDTYGRLTGETTEEASLFEIECVVTDSPGGGVFGDPTASYQAVLDTYATYTALQATETSYLDLLKGV